ncbi:MAG TPA: PDZ domain-containing protein [Denitromonas sp.]|nr:PDZ domain-containing protein [Denitromonas sp.]
MTAAPIRYSIQPIDLAGHLFSVSCEIGAPAPAGQCLSLPAWIPGSYMIRDFARNIVSMSAESEGKPVGLEKLDKHTWRAAPVADGAVLRLIYTVYAWDLSVRTAHLDQTHGFFNGTSVFLAVEGQTDLPCQVDILPPPADAVGHWRVATAMREAVDVDGAAHRHGFGWYEADNYDELIDHPVEMGDFTLASFEAGGVVHEIVLTGRHDCDLARLCEDLTQICQWQIDLFGGPPPMSRYVFLTMVVGDGYGGLEHRASTALLTRRDDLPFHGMGKQTEGYQRFLGLCSHEYFHSWNVKRIRPAAFIPYDLSRETHTPLLWLFEGFTSYYDDLALVRSGVLAVEDYLGLLGKTVSQVQRGAGRLKQSVAESSFDAWTKYYRQDENAANAIVSYYSKGALIALALDLQIRLHSEGAQSLDDVMRALWQAHGQSDIGVTEEMVFSIVKDIAGSTIARWLRKAVSAAEDMPLARWLKKFGVQLQIDVADTASLGGRLGATSGPAVLSVVHEGSAAHRAGLSAGDTLIAIDDLKVTAETLVPMLARRAAGSTVRIHAFRRDELMCFDATLDSGDSTTRLALLERPATPMRRLRHGWLGR